MKAAVLIDTWFPFIGGGQINAYEISKLLAKREISIDIITRNCGDEDTKRYENLKIIKLGKRSSPASIFFKISFLFKSFLYVYKNNYDLVHAHAFLPGITARLISVFKGIPSILTVHGTSLGTSLNGELSRYIERLILTKINYSSQITVSRNFLNIENINKKVFYIPNAVNIDSFDKVSVKKQLQPTIIFVGRLHPQKNVVNLINAIKILKIEIPDIKLKLVGKGPLKEKIKGLIKKEKLLNNISLIGQVLRTDLIKLYKSSSIFVLPSIYEGQSLALLEAWAAKVPVITTRTGDSQYLVKDGHNGYLINDPLDSTEIAMTIKKALSNKKLNKIGISGYNFVRKNFSWKKSAELTLEVYEKVTKASR